MELEWEIINIINASWLVTCELSHWIKSLGHNATDFRIKAEIIPDYDNVEYKDYSMYNVDCVEVGTEQGTPPTEQTT